MAIRTCEEENKDICSSSCRSTVEGTLFKEHHCKEARRSQASLLLENIAPRAHRASSSSGLMHSVLS